MRNSFPGTCYRCGTLCAAGEGHFERIPGRWRVQHASCAIEYRNKPDPAREAAKALARKQRKKLKRDALRETTLIAAAALCSCSSLPVDNNNVEAV